MIKTVTKIGPQDQGRRMALEDFEHAVGQVGYNYELGRGVVIVMDVSGLPHFLKVQSTRLQLTEYQLANRSRIFALAAGNECKILLADLESERHPDIAVYLNPPPDEEDFWAIWVPEIVIEVVSLGGETRDYVEKREEYLAFGVKEYWIIDPEKQEMLVLRRSRGKWVEQTIKPPAEYETKLLPGFKLATQPIFG